jgi:hypothetical protein
MAANGFRLRSAVCDCRFAGLLSFVWYRTSPHAFSFLCHLTCSLSLVPSHLLLLLPHLALCLPLSLEVGLEMEVEVVAVTFCHAPMP